jgi:glycosyltransferase involved in cell wall biosynthesis
MTHGAHSSPLADDWPRISVIVPSYNAGAFLRQALASVLDQVPGPYEILVQDGGSSDETLDILRYLGERIAWVSAPDHGQSDALNRALARATGDVILWLNADDLVRPGAFEAARSAFAADPGLAFAYGDFDIVDGGGATIRRYRSGAYSWERVYARGCYIFSGSLFIRRTALIDVGGFDPSLRTCMDLDLLLRLGTAGRSRHLGRTIGQFRVHGVGKSSTIGLVFMRETLRVRRKYAGRSGRRWLVALGSVPLYLAGVATTSLRFSSLWPRHGRSKTL